MPEDQFTIGEMAKICHISTEQLRHYDRTGVLSPQGRGKNNNYRYYTLEQINDIMVIKELKSIGIPLKTIAEFIKHKDLATIYSTFEASMHMQREALYEKMRQYDLLLDRMLTLNRAFSEMARVREQSHHSIHEGFSIIPIAERPIISARGISNCYVEDHYLYRYIELQNLIEREKVAVGRSWFIIFHDHYSKQFDEGRDAKGDMEFFVNVTGDVGSGTCYRNFGGFLAACATHVGPYKTTKQTYKELTAWIQSIGYSTNGISFQEQIIGRSLTDKEEDFVTKIYLPLNQKTI